MSSVGSSGKNTRQLQNDFNKSMEGRLFCFTRKAACGASTKGRMDAHKLFLGAHQKQISSLESSEGWSSFCIDYVLITHTHNMVEFDDVKT